MKNLLLGMFLLMSVVLTAQPLRDINYNYMYDPGRPFSFTMKAVRQADGWKAFCKVHARDTAQHYVISWELRTALSDKEGQALEASAVSEQKTQGGIYGQANVALSAAVQVLAVKVVSVTLKQAWYYYLLLDPNYPLNAYLSEGGQAVLQPYINSITPVTIEGAASPSVVTLFLDDFPAGAPVFSEGQARVNKTIRQDSVFTIIPGEKRTFAIPGLYLVQKDTSATEGLPFRVGDDYPRFSRIESLADPLIYICTKQEFDRVKAAKGDKKAFDRVILNITGDTDRARDLIRSYFRRVELANQYFTSYKEGWKTDRGMVYIIFGLPDAVYRFADREVWSYDNAVSRNDFEFAKSPSLFDPDNFVLVRKKKYQDSWYEVIDLWRNARF